MQELTWLKRNNDDTLLITKVKTRQNEDRFVFDNESFTIMVTAAPKEGKANKKLINMLRKKFKTNVFLESGQTSASKVFRLKEITPNQILELLEEK
ncbi:MAG: DUF167 domain-containing protein [Candidatus Hodarchaeota archaeon]